MCDTFVALPSHITNGTTIFGKNSDREPNEAQAILRIPHKLHKEKTVQCTYIAIPQVNESYEVILSKPFQMWGAEMGVNEKGLAIGNEAVFTRFSFEKKNKGLTGMDLLRLALERTATAIQALELITALLEEYGQDACGGYLNKNFFYHNSFLLADTREAWVLETAGKEWAAQKVEKFRAISNGLSIGKDFHLISKNAIETAYQKGWVNKGEDFDFNKAFSQKLMPWLSACKLRRNHNEKALSGKNTGFELPDAMAMLCSHPLSDENFHPARARMSSICMHSAGLFTPSQTTGSMVAEIRKEGIATVWLTGTSMPCLSLYKPFFIPGKNLQENSFLQPGAKADPSLWWQAEAFHRLVCRDYGRFKAFLNEEKDVLQQKFICRTARLMQQTPAPTEDWDVFSDECLIEHLEFIKQNKKSIGLIKTPARWSGFFYQLYNRKLNQMAGL